MTQKTLSATLALLFLFGSSSAFSDGWDYNVGAGARLLPQGGGFTGNLGYGYRLWDDSSTESYRYGYIRPSVKGYSSYLVSQIGVELDIFPISLVGVTFGYMQSSRNTDFNTVDCTTISCRGNLGFAYGRVQGAMGYKNIFLVASGQAANITPSVKDRPFADENSMLIGKTGGDEIVSVDMSLGYKIDVRYSAGFHFSKDIVSSSSADNNHESLFVRRKWGDWNFLLGAGGYGSPLQPYGFTSYFLVRWVGKPSIALF